MCVAIVMEPGTELTGEEVFKMGRSNADGIGVAWAEDGKVEWYKSINYTPTSATRFINERKGFFRLVHFRLSTIGGVRVDLCHPFEVGPLANPAQHGHSAKVLIHNGHWNRWTDIIDILRKEEALPDNGPWSDSRLAAYLASFDQDWLDLVTGRVATMDGEGNIKMLGSWETLRPGIKVSNKHWDHGFNYRRSGRDRDWPGWGWTAKEWEEQEKHHEKLAEEAKRARDEQESKDQEEGKGGKTQAKGEIRVGGGPVHGGTVAASAKTEGKTTPSTGVGGGAGTKVNGQGIGPHRYWVGDKEVIEQSGSFVTNGSVKVDVKGNEVRFDHTPWQNPVTKRWFWIPPESVQGIRYRVEEIDGNRARAILESIAAPFPDADGE